MRMSDHDPNACWSLAVCSMRDFLALDVWFQLLSGHGWQFFCFFCFYARDTVGQCVFG